MAGLRFDKIFDGNIIQTVKGAELIQSELNFLFTIPKNSLFFGNNLGIDLERYLYLLNTQASYNLIKSEIENTLTKYGRVYLQRIEMRFNNQKDGLTIDIEVSTDSRGNNLITLPIALGQSTGG